MRHRLTIHKQLHSHNCGCEGMGENTVMESQSPTIIGQQLAPSAEITTKEQALVTPLSVINPLQPGNGVEAPTEEVEAFQKNYADLTDKLSSSVQTTLKEDKLEIVQDLLNQVYSYLEELKVDPSYVEFDGPRFEGFTTYTHSSSNSFSHVAIKVGKYIIDPFHALCGSNYIGNDVYLVTDVEKFFESRLESKKFPIQAPPKMKEVGHKVLKRNRGLNRATQTISIE